MAAEIVMPKFGFSMELGTLVEWKVKVGDPVKRNDPIAEIESEKLTNTANSTIDGVVAALLMEEGDEAPCGTPIAIIAAEGEDIAAAAASAGAKAAEAAAEPAAEAPAAEAPAPDKAVTPRAQVLAERKGIAVSALAGSGQGGAVTIDDVRNAGSAGAAAPKELPKIAPRALKYAEDNDLDYSNVKGTGRLGLITIKDLKEQAVKKAAPAPAAPASSPEPAPAAPVSSAPAGEAVAMTNMQKAVFKSMYQSLQESAQMTQFADADMAAAKALYQELKPKYAKAGIKLTYTAMIIKAVAMALEAHEDMRIQVVDDKHITYLDKIDIGVAVDVPGGLTVPVIREANLKDLRTICRDLADISERARNKTLVAEDFGGSVMTVTNLGNQGVKYFTPILNYPESVILGTGCMTDTPVVVNGGIFVHPVLGLSLTFDHRVINGLPAAKFLAEITKNLADFRWV